MARPIVVGGETALAEGPPVGGGAGTAIVLSTRGKEVHLPIGAAITLKLASGDRDMADG